MTKSLSALLRHPKWLLALSGAVLTATGAFGFYTPKAFFSSYLITLVFWIQVALGSMALLFLHSLVGGKWVILPAPFLRAQSRTLLFLALLFIPIFFGLENLYIWTNEAYMETSKTLQFKTKFLNVPSYIIRSMIYLGVWLVLLYLHSKFRDDDYKYKGLSGVGLLLLALSGTFASFDWLMTFNPHWHSTAFGAIFIAACLLNATAFALMVSASFYKKIEDGRKRALQDLSTLMFAFLLVWIYVSFGQYLIIWSGQIPHELAWYDQRSHGYWIWVVIALIFARFAVPMLLFLFRKVKSSPSLTYPIALSVFIMGWIECAWLVTPAFEGVNWIWALLYLGVFIGFSALWLGGFSIFLQRELNRPKVREVKT